MDEAVQIIPDGRLAYGMQLPIQSQSTLYAEAWEADAGRDELVAIAQAADRAGFLYVAVCDHVAIPREPAQKMGTTWYDTVATLSYLAALTDHVRLLTHVMVLGYRHPLLTSKAIATLDHLSGGRAILGVGVGHVEGEFEVLAADFANRGKVLDESIGIVRAALLDEWPDHDAVRDHGQRPRPVQQPRPPIWVGGSSKPALRRVAERGDGWLPQGTPRSKMPEQIAYLLTHREKHRPGQPVELGAITEFLHVGEPDFDPGPWSTVGSPDKLAESLNAFARMGVRHVQVRFRSRSAAEQVEQILAFGEQVAPLLEAPAELT